MSSIGRQVQRRSCFLQRRGSVVSEWCSYAALLSVPWNKHTDRRRGEEPRDKVYSAQDNNTNICIYMICLLSKQLMHVMQTHASILPYVHTHTQNKTQTHTRMHKAKNQTNTRGKHVLETQNTHTMTSFRKSGLEPNIASEGLITSRLRTHTLVASGLIH
jgi:hypothetical protein